MVFVRISIYITHEISFVQIEKKKKRIQNKFLLTYLMRIMRLVNNRKNVFTKPTKRPTLKLNTDQKISTIKL